MRSVTCDSGQSSPAHGPLECQPAEHRFTPELWSTCSTIARRQRHTLLSLFRSSTGIRADARPAATGDRPLRAGSTRSRPCACTGSFSATSPDVVWHTAATRSSMLSAPFTGPGRSTTRSGRSAARAQRPCGAGMWRAVGEDGRCCRGLGGRRRGMRGSCWGFQRRRSRWCRTAVTLRCSGRGRRSGRSGQSESAHGPRAALRRTVDRGKATGQVFVELVAAVRARGSACRGRDGRVTDRCVSPWSNLRRPPGWS